MKKQILEVQNYFINKITACQFNVIEIKDTNDVWLTLKVEIDGFTFNFSLKPKSEICTNAFGFMGLEIPNDRLNNLINFIEAHKEKIKAEKIEKLKNELQQLQNS